ncbi:hypothetical protein NW762_001365 [Fusarium torreyae]|uniref:Cylicin II n=1 Tax=Fusarium torreyae TaxID=1237075 RepID=A0A9W8SCC5_9HYPO|nr:hypothetical protein NW762_001365 [Fusarium torreyae]
MAPDPKPPGRKRGRPANASKPADASASQDRPDEYEADVEEAPRPKQRGRPKKQAQEDAPEEAVAQEDKPRRKRGRPSLEDKNADKNAEPATTEDTAQPKRKRGRPSLEDKNAEPATTEDATQPKRKRGRPSLEKIQNENENEKEVEQEAVEDTEKPKRKKKAKATQGEQPEEQPQEESQPRRRGRKPAEQQPEEPESEETEPAPPKRRRREAPEAEPEEEPHEEEQPPQSPRNSLRDLGAEDTHNKGRKAEGSKKKKGRASQENVEEQQDEEPPKKRGRPKGGRPSTEKADEPQQEEEQDTSNKKRNGKDDAPSDSDESLPSPPKPYLHIAPFKRTIRSSTIAAKWSPLTGSSLPAATSILTLAHQPILQRTSTTRNRRTHASAALHLVSRRIERKLARGLPFPPASSSGTTRRRADADGGRAMELDFEAVLDGKTALERQLVPGMHAVELLRAERDRMEKELDNDYEELRKLETNARAQARERKDLFRKAHVLAPTSRPASRDQDTTIISDIKDEGSLKDLVDTPLESLALQLAGHAESIRGNLQQAEGVTPQLNRTKAALQDVLQRYLDGGAYEQVILG